MNPLRSMPEIAPGEEPSLRDPGMPEYAEQEQGEPEVDMLAIAAVGLRILWVERRFLWKSIAWALAIALAFAFLLPVRYESTARLMPPQDNGGAGALVAALSSKAGDALASLGSSLLEMKTSGALFIAIIHGSAVENGLIDEFDLMSLYGTKSRERARKLLDERISTVEDRKSGVLAVSISDRDPQRAAKMTAACVEKLNRVLTAVNNSSAHREREFLESRLKTAEPELYASEKQLSDFSSRNGAVDIKEQGKAILQAGAGVEGELIALQSELKGLEQIYGDENVRVRSVRARINALQSQLRTMSGAQSNPPSSTTDGEDVASGSLPTLRQLPSLGEKYTDLFRRVRIQEAVFETLTKEYELAKVQEAKETLTGRVFDPPEVPEKRSFPPRMLIVLLASASGLVFGIVGIFLRRYWARVADDHPAKLLGRDVREHLRIKSRYTDGTPSMTGRGDATVASKGQVTEG